MKLNLYFSSEIRGCLDLFSMPMVLIKNILKLICNDSVQFQMDMRKVAIVVYFSINDAELGHLMLLF